MSETFEVQVKREPYVPWDNYYRGMTPPAIFSSQHEAESEIKELKKHWRGRGFKWRVKRRAAAESR